MKEINFSLRIIYPFTFDENLADFTQSLEKITLIQLSEQLKIPATLQSRIAQSKVADTPIWETFTEGNPYLSKDLYPHFRKLLGDGGDLTNCLQLSTHACQLLDGEFGKNGDGLLLKINASSAKRIAKASGIEDVLPVVPFFIARLSAPQLYLMGFGQGFLELNLSLPKQILDTYGLSIAQEFAHTIVKVSSRATVDKKHLAPLKWQYEYSYDKATFIDNATSLFQIIHSLLGSNTADPIIIQENLELQRYFSYATLYFESSDSDVSIESIGHNLAHRQTIDYKPNIDCYDEFFKPFDNIIHCISVEGGATVIYSNDSSKVEHLKNFINDTLKKAYYPMALVSYIEYIYLVNLTTSFSYKPKQNKQSPEFLKTLEDLQSKILEFRLYYRFSQASGLTQHNDFFRKWRHRFNNEQLSQELLEDINQINEFLLYQADKKAEEVSFKREKTLGVLGIMATTLLSVIGVFGMNMIGYNEFEFMSAITFYTIVVAIICGAIASACYVWILNKED